MQKPLSTQAFYLLAVINQTYSLCPPGIPSYPYAKSPPFSCRPFSPSSSPHPFPPPFLPLHSPPPSPSPRSQQGTISERHCRLGHSVCLQLLINPIAYVHSGIPSYPSVKYPLLLPLLLPIPIPSIPFPINPPPHPK